MATGGMRRLKQQNYDAFNILKNAIINYMNKSVFKPSRFDTIRGEDEGLYGWVAANSVDNLFGVGLVPHGFMEMGGESAQIAVSLTRDQYLGYGGLLKGVEIGGRRYAVFSKTWPGLGVESAWRRHEENLRECGSALAYDPCLPNQFAYRLSGSDKIVVGTGNFPECLKETITLLGCPSDACADGRLCIYRGPGPHGPNPHGDRVGCLLRDPLTGNPFMRFNENQFRGASVYTRATRGVFAELDPQVVIDNPFGAFWDRVTSLSGRNWGQLKADRPREKETDYRYLQKAFFMAGMIMSTLFFGFGIAMPAQAVAVGNALAIERAQRALYERLAAAQEAQEKVDLAAQEQSWVEGARAVGVAREVRNQRTADLTVVQDLPPVGATQAEIDAIGNGPNNLATANILQTSLAIAVRLDDRRAAVLAAKSAVEAATATLNNAMAATANIRAKLDTVERELNTKRAAVDNARTMPQAGAHHPGQQGLYNDTDADWTLGWVVLYATGKPVVTLSEHTWGGLTPFVPED